MTSKDEPQENHVSTDESGHMSFIDHLTELRSRLLRVIICLALIFSGLAAFAQEIYALVATPVIKVLPEGTSMIATEITSTLFAPLKLTFFVSLALSAPYCLHQAWCFMSPGLYRHEKAIAIPMLSASVILFYTGIAFAFFVVLPLLTFFFANVSPDGVAFMPDIQHYLNMVLKLFFAFGVAFEIPIVILLLIWSDVLSREAIAEQRSYVVVGCFIVAMLLTPPDVFSQAFLAIPMWLLFELGLAMSQLLPKRAL